MRCRSCSMENRAGRRFCRECGAALEAVCESCGAGNEADDKFCGGCGASLGYPESPTGAPAAPEPARAEQRFVSVLFADMVGFTTITERHDSEDIRDLLTIYFDRAREIIERFGGVVDKFIGDAVMGVWGARTAREDDAQRAVRAALELVDMVAALGDEMSFDGLALRAGVNSGLTAVGPGGNETGLVVGDLVNVASRFEALATPGTVWVGPVTEAVTSQAIDYEFIGDQSLKGKSDSVPAWRALRVAAGVGGRADEDTHLPPFVGRERELRLLKDGLAGVEVEQRARLISIIGEAGIGKTRLAEEFRNHIDGYTHTIYWHWGRSPSYGDGVAFWALGEMVRRRAGILEGEDPARSRARLRSTITEFVSSEGDRQWIEPHLEGLLGLSEMPATSRAELFAALRSFFQRIADRGPTVLVFEDLHWADPGLLDFVDELVERSAKSPILVVTLARPDLLRRSPDWGSRHRSSLAVRLGPLSGAEMRSLLDRYLPGVEEQVVERIVARSAGFPLYAVEIVRMLSTSGQLRQEGGIYRFDGDPASMALPEKLQAVIGARLDRLEPVERELLQDAAVLGQTFTLEAMAALSERPIDDIAGALAPLTQLELLEIEDDPGSPERGQFRFVQSMIHEVAYRRLSRDDRRARHLLAAGYYAAKDDPELAGVVARHFMGAYGATPSGPAKEEMASRAIDTLVSAARRAIALHSHEQAIELLEEAIRLAPDDAAKSRLRLEIATPSSEHNEPERGLDHLARARAFYESVGDVRGVRRAAASSAYIHNSHYRSDKALEAVRDVYESMESIDDHVDIYLASEAARSYSLTFNAAEAIAAADRLLPAAEAAGEAEIVLHAMITKATSLAFVGRRIEAYGLLRGAAHEAEQRGFLVAAGRALNNLSAIVARRNPQESRRLAERMEPIVNRIQQASWMVRRARDMAHSALNDGDYDGALAQIDERLSEDLTDFWTAAFTLLRHHAELRRTGANEAFDRAWKAVSFFDGESDPQLRSGVGAHKADLLRDVGDWEAVYDVAIGIDPEFDLSGIWYATHAAAWLGDRTKLEAVAAMITDEPNPFPGSGEYVEAIRLALEGEHDEAAHRFDPIIEDWTFRLLSTELAQAKATFALLVGDHPGAREAARQVSVWLDRTASRSLSRVWARALPASDPRDAAAG